MFSFVAFFCIATTTTKKLNQTKRKLKQGNCLLCSPRYAQYIMLLSHMLCSKLPSFHLYSLAKGKSFDLPIKTSFWRASKGLNRFFFFFLVIGKSNGSLQHPKKSWRSTPSSHTNYYFKEIWFDFFLLFGFWWWQIKWAHLQPKKTKSNLIGNPPSI